MSTFYYPELDSGDLLNLRMACSNTASEWHAKARQEREAGDTEKGDTCDRIAAEYHRLWERFHDVEAASKNEPLWKELHPDVA